MIVCSFIEMDFIVHAPEPESDFDCLQVRDCV